MNLKTIWGEFLDPEEYIGKTDKEILINFSKHLVGDDNEPSPDSEKMVLKNFNFDDKENIISGDFKWPPYNLRDLDDNYLQNIFYYARRKMPLNLPCHYAVYKEGIKRDKNFWK